MIHTKTNLEQQWTIVTVRSKPLSKDNYVTTSNILRIKSTNHDQCRMMVSFGLLRVESTVSKPFWNHQPSNPSGTNSAESGPTVVASKHLSTTLLETLFFASSSTLAVTISWQKGWPAVHIDIGMQWWLMWLKWCHKPAIWEWFIQPMYGDLGDSLLLFCRFHS